MCWVRPSGHWREIQREHGARFYGDGIDCRTSNRTPEEIGALWKRFHGEKIAEQIVGRVDGRVYSVYCEYESDASGEFTVLVGCAVPTDAPAAEGMMKKTVAASRYAVFDVVEPSPSGIAEAWSAVWQTPLERSYETDFERYDENGTISVHVGIG